MTSIALPPLPEGAVLPPEMKIEFGNYLEMSDGDSDKQDIMMPARDSEKSQMNYGNIPRKYRNWMFEKNGKRIVDS